MIRKVFNDSLSHASSHPRQSCYRTALLINLLTCGGARSTSPRKLISFLWKCDLISCARNFHIFVHCVLHDEHVPYTYVLTAFWRICYFPNCWPKKLRNRDFPSPGVFQHLAASLLANVRACHKWNYYHVLKRLSRHGENEKPCYTPIPPRNIIIKHITITFEYWKIMQSKTR